MSTTPSLPRRLFLGSAVLGSLGVLMPALANGPKAQGKDRKMSTSTVTIADTGAAGAAIEPFEFHASDNALADLKRRVGATRWPSRELVPDDTQGVKLATMQKLAEYWAESHDWRRAEMNLNQYPQFITHIDGTDIHFIHVRSKHADALPVVITHGWPGSVIEQLKIIKPLTDPTAFGGTAADAFHVVIPSLPGYGFSPAPTELG